MTTFEVNLPDCLNEQSRELVERNIENQIAHVLKQHGLHKTSTIEKHE